MQKLIISLLALTASVALATPRPNPWTVTFNQGGTPVDGCKGGLVPIPGKEADGTNVVVTTFTCARGANSGLVAVVSSEDGKGTPTEKAIKPNPVCHPLFSERSLEHNIGLVILEAPIKFSDYNKPFQWSFSDEELAKIVPNLKYYQPWIMNEAMKKQ